nr:hypothetical protein CFP56_08861 [Quercus suber]
MAGFHVPRISSPLSALQDPATNRAFVAANPSLQDPDAMHDDIDEGLRFRNYNCFCGMRASMRISDKRNENRYRLLQCCPKDTCSTRRSAPKQARTIGVLVEKTRTSFEGFLNDFPEIMENFTKMVSTVVTDLWNNYKDALGYVTENA